MSRAARGPRSAAGRRRPAPRPERRDAVSLAQEAYGRLKQLIVRCELAPGRRVSETELIQIVGIGKTPVREALARLVQERLMRYLPRQGYQVSPITLRDVQALYRLRMLVEPFMAELAAENVDHVQLRRLDELCQAAHTSGEPAEMDDFLTANRGFHMLVAQATGNRYLVDLYQRLEDESERLFRLALLLPGYRGGIGHGHKELVDALALGDADNARRLTLEGIEASHRAVVEALLSSPAVLSAELSPPEQPARIAS
jgi:DNA-binding GntR family transcriptional regulator